MDTDLNPCDVNELILRENFKKDYKLSCPVLDDNDCFKKSLQIWDLSKEWEAYRLAAKKYPDFDGYRKVIRAKIVKAVEAVSGYDKLAPVNNPHGTFSGPRTYLRPEAVGKKLVSIDLVKGNFQSLKYLGPQFVLNCDTYEDFIRKFTKESTLVNSKYFRQMIFGLLKPSVQASVQQMMMSHIVKLILARVKDLTIEHLTNDEVVFSFTTISQKLQIAEAIRHLPYQYRIEEFTITHIENWFEEPWYVRWGENRKRRLMSVHVKYLFQVYNHVQKIECKEKDFWWRERGRLCCLLEPERFESREKALQKENKPKQKGK